MAESSIQLIAVEEVLDAYNHLMLKEETCRLELDWSIAV